MNPAGHGFDWGVVEQGSHLVLRAIEKARAEAAIDDSRIILAGFSNGASQAFIQGLQDPERFAGILSVSGFYDERVAPVPAGRRLPRFAILNGELDEEAANNRQGRRRPARRGGQGQARDLPRLATPSRPTATARSGPRCRFLLGS